MAEIAIAADRVAISLTGPKVTRSKQRSRPKNSREPGSSAISNSPLPARWQSRPRIWTTRWIPRPPSAYYAEIGYMMPVRGPSEGLAPFFEEFEAAKQDGGLWHAVWHPFLTGRRVAGVQHLSWLWHVLF